MRSVFYTPSAAHRWMRCTASPAAIAAARDEGIISEHSASSADSVEGTKAHAYAAEALVMGEVPPIGNLDMQDAVTAYFELVMGMMAPDDELFVETKVPLYYEPASVGTTDVALVGPRRLIIGDYKNGTGVSVEAIGNEQLLIYAGNFLYSRPDLLVLPDDAEVILFIHQPHAIDKRPYREWAMTLGELRQRLDEIRATVDRLRAGDPGVYHASVETCQFCPLKGLCAHQATSALSELDVVCDEPLATQLKLPAVGALTGEQLARILAASEALKAFLNAAHGVAYDRLERGLPIPGHKLVRGFGNRTWDDAEAAKSVLVAKLGDDAYEPAKLVSPAEAEKRLKRKAKKGEKSDAEIVLSLLTHRPPSKPKLVADGRPEDAVDALSDMPAE